jgi:hypothetical protein
MKRNTVAGFLLVAFLCVPAARSQQSPADQGGSTPATPDQPLPASSTTPSGSGNDAGAAPAGRALLGSGAANASQAAAQPESLPPSGAEQLSIPGTQLANFFDASALFSGSGDSAVINAQGQPTWGANEIAGGQLILDRSWKTSSFSLSYSGGGVFYQPSAEYPAAMYHTLSLSQQFTWNRLTLRLLDQFSYSPNSLFGGAGTGGPGLLAESGPPSSTLNPTYGVNNTILTGQTRLLNNSVVAEIQYNLSLRSSFTVTGSYGVLDYLGAGYISSHDYVLSGGYNFTFTPKDTIDVTYSLTETHYTGLPEGTNYQQVDFGYTRQVSGRLVFQISAGPELIAFHDYTPSVGNTVTWNLNTGVQYRLRRSSLDANFTRGANAGSGVFLGSISDTASGGVNHQFSRFLVGAVTFGYSLNDTLTNTPGVADQYHNWFTGASLGRQLGRHAHVSVNYGAQQQPFGGVCPVSNCGTDRVLQTIGVALDVHLRPLGAGE